jgi:xanthine dehydrogenase accessory factor
MEGELRKVFREAGRLSTAGELAVLAVVVRVRGSAPQRVGAKLVLRSDGRFVGTVGGGAIEAAVIADAMRLLAEGTRRVCTYRLAAELGMCCGGTMEVYLEPLSGDAAAIFQEAERLEREGEGGAYGIVMSSDDAAVPVGAKVLAGPEGLLAHELGDGPLREPLERDLRALAAGGEPRVGAYIMPGGHEIEVYLEPLEVTSRLVIFGAGHVAQPLARVGKLLGFHVIVVDDRTGWANAERFPEADEVVNEPYVDYLSSFRHRASDYLVVVTRGHDHDQEVLETLIDKDCRYLGMIGSRGKIKRAFLRLEAAGVLPQLVRRVRAPVGLNVGAQTPEEIAVAIGAELVMERRGVSRKQVETPGWWREEE